MGTLQRIEAIALLGQKPQRARRQGACTHVRAAGFSERRVTHVGPWFS